MIIYDTYIKQGFPLKIIHYNQVNLSFSPVILILNIMNNIKVIIFKFYILAFMLLMDRKVERVTGKALGEERGAGLTKTQTQLPTSKLFSFTS